MCSIAFTRQAAMHDLDEALRLDGSYAEAYYNRGLANSELSNHSQSIEDFSKAMSLDSSLEISRQPKF